MRGTLLICALAAVQAKVPKKGYNECERFITTIYNSIVDEYYDAPNITLAQRPELAKCRLTRTLSTYEIVGMTAVYTATSRNRTDWLAELLARKALTQQEHDLLVYNPALAETQRHHAVLEWILVRFVTAKRAGLLTGGGLSI